MDHQASPTLYPPVSEESDSGVVTSSSEKMTQRKVQRSGSFSEVEGNMKAGRLSVNLPKRSSSFRSCLKKPSVVLEEPPSE